MKVRNKKQNQAIALLDNERSSPSMIAKDSNELAERIIAIAKQNDIPIKEEPELVKLLSEVALGDEIPKLLYAAVSDVLSFAYMLKTKAVINTNS